MRGVSLACGLLLILAASPVRAQSAAADSTAQPAPAAVTPPPAAAPAVAAPASAAAPAKAAPAEPKKKPYVGGSFGISFGSYSRLSISPLIGYPLAPKVSVGLKGTYEYIHDTRYQTTLTASNYGGSVFAQYRIHPLAYAHVEYAYMSYEYEQFNGSSTRTGVPFLYVGGGVMKPLSPRTAAFVEVLFDVLQDSNSPYTAWQPMVSVGVTSGF